MNVKALFAATLIAISQLWLAAQSAEANTPLSCYDPHSNVTLRPGDTVAMTTSWYGPGLNGGPMANGETFDMYDPTLAAHKVLPLGSKLRIENPSTGAVRIAEVTDDGPHPAGRDLDASLALATALGFKSAGKAELQVTILSFGDDECRDDGKGQR
jgi:rare lipoprotein A (peptidoglycan hydrolase)